MNQLLICHPTTIIQLKVGQNPTTIIQFDAGQNYTLSYMRKTLTRNMGMLLGFYITSQNPTQHLLVHGIRVQPE